MNSPEKVKRSNLYPEERSREQAAEQRARHERLKGSRNLALTRRDLPSRMNSPEKVKRRSRYLRSEAKSKPPSNALGTNRLSRRLSPV
jgi:hypothetical protein